MVIQSEEEGKVCACMCVFVCEEGRRGVVKGARRR